MLTCFLIYILAGWIVSALVRIAWLTDDGPIVISLDRNTVATMLVIRLLEIAAGVWVLVVHLS